MLDEPTISDFEFDAKLKELQELEAAHPEFYDPHSPTLRVGGEITKNFLPFSISSECILWITLMISMIYRIGTLEFLKF